MSVLILPTIRTNNFIDKEHLRKIKHLWEINTLKIETQFSKGGSIVCIYHSYQKDFKSDYSMTICEEELLDKYFDKSNYWWKTYEVEQENQLGLVETWLKIWMEEEQKIIRRVYDFDYAVYHSNGQIEIRIATVK
ncbi:transcriptional regulator [Enterococcus faecalis]|uniref:transcriptional regulator n=1 Tax=Enterococcus faecalis TaxID=1351 RepID=UPI000CF02833|nr:transcriptional regulator [Enterococcus faecalis]MBO6372963.1 transcriptional regulator [Enterococcus faecalis]MCO5486738.1 transcriptional regulator [Enterococcus faecalis]MDN3096590.1 transcriptional regulator [Enterococcus faecalis]PQD11479.1 transcriptional regulator [Enterococcus faecalis]PQG37173.1 transcriptional regulator [Enterococcus faecalis]